MYKNYKICVVVPAYNEEKHLPQVIKTMPEFVDLIVVIDDASTDNTFEIASNTIDDRRFVIKNKVNQGVGGAIISGHKKALELGADISVVMAGDGQMDPKYLPDLLDPIIAQGYHYTKGNRFLKSGALTGMPKLRIFGNIALTFLTKLSSGYWHIFDPQNGYTAIKCNVLREIDLDRVARRYEFENDMLITLNIHNYRVKDIFIPAFYRDEKSKIRLHSFIGRTTSLLFRGFTKRIISKYVLMDFHPIALFLFFGSILFLTGFAIGLYILYSKMIMSGTPTAGTIVLSIMPLFTGFQLLLAGLILDIFETPK